MDRPYQEMPIGRLNFHLLQDDPNTENKDYVIIGLTSRGPREFVLLFRDSFDRIEIDDKIVRVPLPEYLQIDPEKGSSFIMIVVVPSNWEDEVVWQRFDERATLALQSFRRH